MTRLWFLLLALLLLCTNAHAIDATLTKVIDGDTLEVNLSGKKERLRLIGIDTPEKTDNPKAWRDSIRTDRDIKTILAMGEKAAKHMSMLTRFNPKLKIEFDADKHDKYGRLLAYVFLKDGTMLNEQLLRDGYAQLMTIPPNVHYKKRLRTALNDAREHKRGLWAN